MSTPTHAQLSALCLILASEITELNDIAEQSEHRAFSRTLKNHPQTVVDYNERARLSRAEASSLFETLNWLLVQTEEQQKSEAEQPKIRTAAHQLVRNMKEAAQ